MNNIKLSVIIPTYNCEKYLEASLYKIKPFLNDVTEFIFIDDKSSDTTLQILDTFCRGAKGNVTVIQNPENMGPGVARNVGVAKSVGEYITFLDADDYLDTDFIEKIYPELDGKNDLILFDYFEEYNGIMNPKKTVRANCEHLTLADVLIFTTGCPWGKIYRSSIIKKFNVQFLNQKRNEDMPFTKVAISYCDTFSYVESPIYHYVQNKSSLTHDNTIQNKNSGENAYNYIQDKLNPLFNGEELDAVFYNDYLFGSAMISSSKLNRSDWIRYLRETEIIRPNWHRSKYIGKMPMIRKLCGVLIKNKCYFLIKLLNIIKIKRNKVQ